MQGAQVWSLVRELRSHMLHGEAKEKKKKKMLEMHCNGTHRENKTESQRLHGGRPSGWSTKLAWCAGYFRWLTQYPPPPGGLHDDHSSLFNYSLFFFFWSTLSGMWNPSFLTRDQTHVPYSVLTTESPGSPVKWQSWLSYSNWTSFSFQDTLSPGLI